MRNQTYFLFLSLLINSIFLVVVPLSTDLYILHITYYSVFHFHWKLHWLTLSSWIPTTPSTNTSKHLVPQSYKIVIFVIEKVTNSLHTSHWFDEFLLALCLHFYSISTQSQNPNKSTVKFHCKNHIHICYIHNEFLPHLLFFYDLYLFYLFIFLFMTEHIDSLKLLLFYSFFFILFWILKLIWKWKKKLMKKVVLQNYTFYIYFVYTAILAKRKKYYRIDFFTVLLYIHRIFY